MQWTGFCTNFYRKKCLNRLQNEIKEFDLRELAQQLYFAEDVKYNITEADNNHLGEAQC